NSGAHVISAHHVHVAHDHGARNAIHTRRNVSARRSSMNKKFDGGGHAYPQSISAGPSGDTYISNEFDGGSGATLWDYFAAHALAGISHALNIKSPDAAFLAAKLADA